MSQMDIDTRQEIEQIVMRMLVRYAQLNDAHQWDDLAAMFTLDGRYIRPSAPDDVIVGRNAILNELKSRPPAATRHIVSNVLVEVEHPAHLTAQSTVLLFRGEPAAPGSGELPKMQAGCPLVGTFQDVIVMEPKGYFFAERRGGLDFAP